MTYTKIVAITSISLVSFLLVYLYSQNDKASTEMPATPTQVDTENVMTQYKDTERTPLSVQMEEPYHEDENVIDESAIEIEQHDVDAAITPEENLIAKDEPFAVLEKEHTEKAFNLDMEKGIENCMKEKGFQYHIINNESSDSFDEAHLNENDEYVNTLTPEQQSEYLLALYGNQEATYQQLQTSSYPGAEQGCINLVAGQSDPVLESVLEIQDKLMNIGNSDSLFSDANVVSAMTNWSNCMAEKMLFYTTPQEFYTSLKQIAATEGSDLKDTTESVQTSLYCEQVSGLDVEMNQAAEAYK